MSFNAFKRLLATAVSCSFLLSCGLKTGESAPQPKAPSYSGAGYNCVGEIPQTIGKYVSDELDENQITEFVRCLQKSFTSFAELTRGRDSASYAPEEIRKFLQDYFIKSHTMSDELMRQFMVVKRVLIGGEEARISRHELHLAVEVLEEIRREAIRLKPHLRVLNPKLAVLNDPRGLGQKLSEANEALKGTIQIFSKRLQTTQNPYRFSDMEKFLTEFRAFIDWEKEYPDALVSKRWIDVLRIFKEVTISPASPDAILVSEWTPLLESMARWYLAYLQYQVGIKGQPLLHGIGFQNILYIAQEVFDLFEQSVLRQPAKLVSFDQLDRLVEAIDGVKWMPLGIRAISAKQAIRLFFSRILGDELMKPSERVETGVNINNLLTMKSEFYRWAYVQQNLDTQFQEEIQSMAGTESVPSIQRPITIPDGVRNVILNLRTSDWNEFNKIVNLSRPLYGNNDNRILLVGESQFREYNLHHGFTDLSAMNLLRMVTLLIFRGYAEETPGTSWKSGISQTELQKFYDDFRQIGIDVGFIDPRALTAGRRGYIEGNLFTYQSDGFTRPGTDLSQQLSFVETMHLFGFLYSGAQVSARLYNEISAKCSAGPNDIFNRPMIPRSCVEERLGAALMNHFTNGPWAVDFLRTANAETRATYIQNLIKTAYSPSSRPDFVEASELTTIAVVLHYAEAVMTRFDENLDGQLDDDEIRKATPMFINFIQITAKETGRGDYDEAFARGIFRLMLEKRGMPEWYNIMGILDHWAEWKLPVDLYFWKFEVPLVMPPKISIDRIGMSQVFFSIIQELYKSSERPVGGG